MNGIPWFNGIDNWLTHHHSRLFAASPRPPSSSPWGSGHQNGTPTLAGRPLLRLVETRGFRSTVHGDLALKAEMALRLGSWFETSNLYIYNHIHPISSFLCVCYLFMTVLRCSWIVWILDNLRDVNDAIDAARISGINYLYYITMVRPTQDKLRPSITSWAWFEMFPLFFVNEALSKPLASGASSSFELDLRWKRFSCTSVDKDSAWVQPRATPCALSTGSFKLGSWASPNRSDRV